MSDKRREVKEWYDGFTFGNKKYEVALLSKGIPKEKIRKYGFAFQGKKVLIGK